MRTSEVLAFHDIHPIAPVHFLMIPKEHVRVDDRNRGRIMQQVLGKMMVLAPRLAREQGADGRFPVDRQHRAGGTAGSVAMCTCMCSAAVSRSGPMLPRPER